MDTAEQLGVQNGNVFDCMYKRSKEESNIMVPHILGENLNPEVFEYYDNIALCRGNNTKN